MCIMLLIAIRFERKIAKKKFDLEKEKITKYIITNKNVIEKSKNIKIRSFDEYSDQFFKRIEDKLFISLEGVNKFTIEKEGKTNSFYFFLTNDAKAILNLDFQSKKNFYAAKILLIELLPFRCETITKYKQIYYKQ